MIAHKYLGAGAEGVFSGFKWPTPLAGQPGPWVGVSGPLTPGSNGIHACTNLDLINWMDDELWLVELDGEIQQADGVLVARRGRLLGLIEAWDGAMAQQFATTCVYSARNVAVEALGRTGRRMDADALAAVEALDVLQATALSLAPTTTGFACDAVAFLADTVQLFKGERPDHYGEHPGGGTKPTAGAIAANLGFVASHIVGRGWADATGDAAAYDAGVERERVRQRAWLADRVL